MNLADVPLSSAQTTPTFPGSDPHTTLWHKPNPAMRRLKSARWRHAPLVPSQSNSPLGIHPFGAPLHAAALSCLRELLTFPHLLNDAHAACGSNLKPWTALSLLTTIEGSTAALAVYALKPLQVKAASPCNVPHDTSSPKRSHSRRKGIRAHSPKRPREALPSPPSQLTSASPHVPQNTPTHPNT